MMIQVEDDIALLDLMLRDHENAPPDFRPTKKWLGYSETFVEFLRTEGLKDFRSRRVDREHPGFVLSRFGANDLNLSAELPYSSPEDMYHAARTAFLGEGAKSVDELPSSTVGNPEGFTINGNFYTMSWLNFFCRYAYVSKFVKFKDQVIVEVGPGSGKQAEMLKRAHPGLTIVLFDLPTQLYVCNQYLTKVFEATDQVVDYRNTESIRSFQDIKKGKINILPHWKAPMLEGRTFDLFWNAASLQEMGKHEALNYFRWVKGADALFLLYTIKNNQSRKAPGDRGVIEPDFLQGFAEVDRINAKRVWSTGYSPYYDSFWVRRRFSSVGQTKARRAINKIKRGISKVLRPQA
jgi:putative sugar O-methyltransferase